MTEDHSINHQQQILVVEDCEDIRTMLGHLLKIEGYRAIFAEDGQAALSQAELHHPDLILMDLSLPKMDGWEAVQQLRTMAAFRTTPIIAVTAQVSPAHQERAFAVGCTLHLGKPFQISRLLQYIARLLGKEEPHAGN